MGAEGTTPCRSTPIAEKKPSLQPVQPVRLEWVDPACKDSLGKSNAKGFCKGYGGKPSSKGQLVNKADRLCDCCLLWGH